MNNNDNKANNNHINNDRLPAHALLQEGPQAVAQGLGLYVLF